MQNSALFKALQDRGLSGAPKALSEAPPSPMPAPSPSAGMGSPLFNALQPSNEVAQSGFPVLINQKAKGQMQQEAIDAMTRPKG